jgi:class 3 adenylate cyclase
MLACPNCGQQNRDAARFCDACGASLAEPAPAREERKVVTVLFADLVGFTSRAERMDPEDVRALLAPYYVRLRAELERFGGTVEKFIGDAAMALFGAPIAHEDDAERAVRAALAIRRWITEEGEDLLVRMAVNTGVALVSLDARAHEGEAMAAGDVVNTAQRLQVAAPINGILVGEQTYRATREAIEYDAAAPVEAKGKSRPILAWEALEARSRLGIDLLREPNTPFVGRQRELDLLVSALARVREERSPQLVTLVGVPGIGKSRLVLKLAMAVEQDREAITWRQGRCLPYGDGVSFWALGETVKSQAGILESDSPAQAEEKLRNAVAELVSEAQEARWVAERLRPLVGVAGEPGSVERAGEAFPAWRRFLEGLADLRPLVLVLEDLHWADEGLLDFVDELADRIRDAPLLALCTARPELLERRPGWGGGKANALTISLPPLSEDETGRVAASVLEQPILEADVHKALLARAGGNPLYAEQLARVLAELGTLDELPETVHGIIAARLDGLRPQEKALLQDAAVVGKVFWLGALETIRHGSRRQAEELLYGLERKEFVQRTRRSSVADEAEYTFRHVLLRDVAYGQIPRAARGDKHSRAAAWIESLGRPEDHAEMLAHHYLNALEYARAARRAEPALGERARLALRAAGDRALALASYAAAARFYDAALEVWPESDPDRAALLVRAGGERHETSGTGIDLLQEGLKDLLSKGDVEGAAEVAVYLARCFWFRGERDAAYAYVDRALAQSEGRRASRARVQALVARAGYHMIASEHADAIKAALQALPLTEQLGMDELRVRTLDVLGAARAYSGDAAGLHESMRAIALARETKAFYYLMHAEINSYSSQLALGQLDAASETLSMFRRDFQSYGTAMVERFLRGLEAFEAFVHGQWDDALGVLDQLIAGAAAGGVHYLEPSWRALRASIELARGELEGAAIDGEVALEHARRRKDPQILAPALAVRSLVLLEQGLREEASSLASELLASGTMLSALLEAVPALTPVEFAWLMRDLGREPELRSLLELVPATPWFDAARAIGQGDVVRSVEVVLGIGAPAVEAYARLRAAQELARAGPHAEARDCLAPALAFFRKVGATRYIAQAEQVLTPAA